MVTQKSSKNKENDDIEAIVPLLPIKHASEDETRAHYITFEVRVVADSNEAGKYKKHMRLFEGLALLQTFYYDKERLKIYRF